MSTISAGGDSTVSVTLPADEARRARILEGATRVFLAYGFQRTTMDDIARAAEISRPALYLQFRNKTDIYRALARQFLDQTIANARLVLATEAPLADRLGRAVFCIHDMMQEIEASPHGAEILDMKNSLAADIVTSGRAELHAMVEAAMTAEAAGRVGELATAGLTPGLVADCLLDAIDGLKQRGASSDAQRTGIAAYIALVTRAVGG